jgi:isocitrate dehydrogenase (NAD+)
LELWKNIKKALSSQGPEIAASVQRIFAAAEAPIAWDSVDVTPVRNPDGTMGIPKVTVHSKIHYLSSLLVPVHIYGFLSS